MAPPVVANRLPVSDRLSPNTTSSVKDPADVAVASISERMLSETSSTTRSGERRLDERSILTLLGSCEAMGRHERVEARECGR